MTSPVPLYFTTWSDKRHDFRGKELLNIKRVWISSTTFVYSILHSKKNLARYRQKCRNVFTSSTRYSSQILMKHESSQHIFEKKKIKYQVSSTSVNWEPSCPVRTDGHDEANSHYLQFCECASVSGANTVVDADTHHTIRYLRIWTSYCVRRCFISENFIHFDYFILWADTRVCAWNLILVRTGRGSNPGGGKIFRMLF